MTCITCGGPLDTTSTTCPACGELAASPVGADPAAVSAPAPVSAPTAVSAPAPVAQAGRTGVGDAGEGPEDPWGRSGDGGASHGGGASGQPPGSGGPPHGGGGAVPPGGWGAPPPHPSGLSSEVRGWGIAIHLAGLIAALASAAILGFVGPLLLWLLKREDHPFIDHHGKEALNFQITVVLALAVGAVLTVPAVIVGIVTFGLGLILLGLVALAAMVLWIVFPIMGAVKAANGQGFRYPISIRFIR